MMMPRWRRNRDPALLDLQAQSARCCSEVRADESGRLLKN